MSRFRLSAWWPRLLTLCLAGLAAASIAAWVLKVEGLRTSEPVVPVSAALNFSPDVTLVAKALGGGAVLAASPEAPTVLASSRFVLVGVLASGAGGAALLGVDGKPAKPFAVGAKVVDEFVLTSVQARKVVLSRGTALNAASDVVLMLPLASDKKSL